MYGCFIIGFYLYIEILVFRLSGDVVCIYFFFISSLYLVDCLVFYYYMFGEYVVYLKVFIEIIEGYE